MKFLIAFILSAGVSLAGPRGSLDPRTAAYADRVYDGAGVAPAMLGRAQVAAFVQNSVVIQLWPNMVCWPLRSSQNAGTGSTAYSLGGLGTYNGTLVNGPTWGADGMTFVATSTQYISTDYFNSLADNLFCFTVSSHNASVSNQKIACCDFSGASGRAWELTANSTVFLFPNGSGVSITGSSDATSTISSRAIIYNATEGGLKLLNSSVQGTPISYTGPLPTAGNAAGRFAIGGRGGVGIGMVEGSISFVLLARVDSGAATLNSQLRALYKSTIGQGLGLP